MSFILKQALPIAAGSVLRKKVTVEPTKHYMKRATANETDNHGALKRPSLHSRLQFATISPAGIFGQVTVPIPHHAITWKPSTVKRFESKTRDELLAHNRVLGAEFWKLRAQNRQLQMQVIELEGKGKITEKSLMKEALKAGRWREKCREQIKQKKVAEKVAKGLQDKELEYEIMAAKLEETKKELQRERRARKMVDTRRAQEKAMTKAFKESIQALM